MIVKLILLFLFNLVYTLNNYSGISLVIINIILFLFSFFISRIKFKFNLKQVLFSILVTILLLILNNDIFIYGYDDKDIKITNLSDKTVQISSIYLNNKKVKLNNLKLDDVILYDNYNKLDDNYKIDLVDSYSFKTKKAKKIIINFEKYKDSYKISVNNEVLNIASSVVNRNSDYYKIYENYFSYNINNINYDNEYRILNLIICFLGLNIIILTLLELIKKKNLIFIFLALSLFIFEFNSLILINILTKILIYILVLIICFTIKNNKEYFIVKINKDFILKLISSLIVSFCFIGNLYLGHKIDINDIIIYILFTLWFIYIIDFIKYIMIIIKEKSKCKNTKKILDRILLFLIPLIIFLVYLYIFSPYIITTDGDMQLDQIHDGIINNWHPYIHTLLLSAVYDVFGNFQMFIIIRIIITSLIISIIGCYFINKGIKRILIYILTILICINPITGVYMVSILKDVDYIIFLILLTFLLIKYVNMDIKIYDYFFIVLSLIFIVAFRHNGLYVALLCVLILLIIGFKLKDKKLFIISLLVPIILYFGNKFLYDFFYVLPGLENSDVVTLVHGLQKVLIEKDDQEIANNFKNDIKISELKDSYNRYNIDILLHYNKVPIRSIEINKGKLIKLYLKKLFRYPNILLQDRLYGIDILWNAFKSDDIQTYDYQIFENEFGFEFYSDYDITIKNNSFKQCIINVLLFISNNKILNAIFLRAGLYLSLLVIFTINFYDRKNCLILLPSFANILTFLIALHHQSYRYIMFVPIVFILFILQFIISKTKNNN